MVCPASRAIMPRAARASDSRVLVCGVALLGFGIALLLASLASGIVGPAPGLPTTLELTRIAVRILAEHLLGLAHATPRPAQSVRRAADNIAARTGIDTRRARAHQPTHRNRRLPPPTPCARAGCHHAVCVWGGVVGSVCTPERAQHTATAVWPRRAAVRTPHECNCACMGACTVAHPHVCERPTVA